MNYWTIVFGAGLYVQTDKPVKTKKAFMRKRQIAFGEGIGGIRPNKSGVSA
jgi:hypothetical protein